MPISPIVGPTTVFDIGNTIRSALKRFERTREPYCGPTDPHMAGNGSIMRLAPVGLFYARNPHEAIEKAGEGSRSTHGAREAIDACRYLTGLIIGGLGGLEKEELLSERFSQVPGLWEDAPLAPRVAAIAAGSFKRKDPPEIRGSGYVVESLEAVLWPFHRSSSFRDGALLAVNLGDDADTTRAVYGELAGAFYGEQSIPDTRRLWLAHRDLIEKYAEQLHAPARHACMAVRPAVGRS